MMAWTVHKFGGTSVADASCVRRVAGIVAGEQSGNLGVVVSAMRGVTDDLLGLIEKAARREPVTSAVGALRERHEKSTVELLGAARAKPLLAELNQELEEIESILKALTLVRSASQRSRDLVSGFGEVWSARLIAAFSIVRRMLDVTTEVAETSSSSNARDVLVIEHGEMGPVVAWDASRPKLAAVVPPNFEASP